MLLLFVLTQKTLLVLRTSSNVGMDVVSVRGRCVTRPMTAETGLTNTHIMTAVSSQTIICVTVLGLNNSSTIFFKEGTESAVTLMEGGYHDCV